MRRHTPGVVPGTHLIPALIARAEQQDAKRVIRLLEPLVLERRRERLLQVIHRRLASIQVVFDAPHDPHNGAAVVRTCEALGVQFVHVIERKELFLASPTVARGSEKWVDLKRWSSVGACVEALQAQDLELVAAHPDGELAPSDLAKIPRMALVLGNERDGIAADLAEKCTKRVRVPMRGFVESLNVSVTAAVLLSHAVADRPGDLSESDRDRLFARGLYFTVDRADEVLKED